MNAHELAHYIHEYDVSKNNPAQSSPICSERLLAAAIQEDLDNGAPTLELSWVHAIFEEGYDIDTCSLRKHYPFTAAVWDQSYCVL